MAVLERPAETRPEGGQIRADGSPRDATDGLAGAGVRGWSAVLVGVGAGYAAWSYATTRTMGWGRDEVVYLSQVSPFSHPAYFSAPRARGITWLVAPIAHVTDDVATIRLYLAVLSGVALVACLWPWLRVRGLRSPAVAPVAGALFASLWLARFYAAQIMPNLWIAFGAVGAVGLLLRLASPGGFRWWRLTLLGLVTAGVTLLRPSDAAVLAAVLVVAGLFVIRARWWWHGLTTAAVVGIGVVAGLVPWVVESQQRFGGVTARLQQAAGTEGGVGLGFRLGLHLKVMDGPILCRPTCRAAGQPVPTDALALFGIVSALVLLALVLAWRGRHLSAVLTPTLAAVALAAPYLTAVGYAVPRFLLPAYALAALPVALALVTLVRATPGRWALLTAAVILGVLGLHLADQQAVLHRLTAAQDAKRARIELVADYLRAQGIRPGCVVSGTDAPQIAHALDCTSAALAGHDANTTRGELLRLATTTQVVLTRRTPTLSTTPPAWAGGGWTGHRVPGLPHKWALVVFLPN